MYFYLLMIHLFISSNFLLTNFRLFIYTVQKHVFISILLFLVISRNILTDPASLQPVADEGETGLDTVSLSSSTLIQSEGVGAEADGGAVAAVHEETFKSPENVDGDISVQERNSSAPAHGVDRAAGKRQRDVAKPAHADEM